MLNPDWDIKPRGLACAQCAAAFQDAQEYVSALLFTSEGYQRQDHCLACWTAQPAPRATLVSQWKGIFRAPPAPAPEPLNRENVERMLRELMEHADSARLNVIYILAVILERRRILIEKDVQKRPDGLLTRVYEHRRTGETFLITDPMLALDQLEHVRREVQELIDGPAAPPMAGAGPVDALTPDGAAAAPPAAPPSA